VHDPEVVDYVFRLACSSGYKFFSSMGYPFVFLIASYDAAHRVDEETCEDGVPVAGLGSVVVVVVYSVDFFKVTYEWGRVVSCRGEVRLMTYRRRGKNWMWTG
jgi:hypothetical protein